ncbi:hypothetical protein Q3G72_030297 [Acer saccharum]|nr:hypothetical protein Q3G72_026955 [Acer saccharum]KAK1584152.1 hypothetical protein Q3G72_030297 [Acer saccharum]
MKTPYVLQNTQKLLIDEIRSNEVVLEDELDAPMALLDGKGQQARKPGNNNPGDQKEKPPEAHKSHFTFRLIGWIDYDLNVHLLHGLRILFSVVPI